MLSDAIDSFKDNIKQKIANPFLGTFLLVWIVKNWKVVYAFFFFDKEHKLKNRIDYFNAYWREHNFIGNLIGVVMLTILILVFTYLFLALSRFISNYYENVIIPQIQKWSKGEIVTSDVHNVALNTITLLQQRIEEERKAKVEAVNERDEIEKKFFSKVLSENGKEANLGSDNSSVTDFAGNDFSIDRIIEEGIKDFSRSNLIDTIIEIQKNQGFSQKHSLINFLIRYSLIDFKSDDSYGRKYYKLNVFGQQFYNRLLSYDENKLTS